MPILFSGIYYLRVHSNKEYKMKREAVVLTKDWCGESSSLSLRAVDAKRVSVDAKHNRPDGRLAEFIILVDGQPTFHAKTQYVSVQTACAWVYLKVSANRWCGYWLYQIARTDIQLSRVAFALSTWYFDSILADDRKHIVCYFTQRLEIKSNRNWSTLYARHPLVRSSGLGIVPTRNDKTRLEWWDRNTQMDLDTLYRQVAKLPGNKVSFCPIV